MKPFSIIAAIDQDNGIGKDGSLPWHLPADLKYYSRVTKTTDNPNLQNAVIMGRRTWESLPAKYKPQPDRFNIVISSQPDLDLPEGVLQFNTLDQALMAIATSNKIDQAFVVGGARLYQEAILHPACQKIYLTKIEDQFDCDTFFPDQIPTDFEIISATEVLTDNDLDYIHYILAARD